jgi:DUF1707 SHOCT-like domain
MMSSNYRDFPHPGSDYERITTETVKRVPGALPGAVAPEGANITADKRVGDAHRAKVISHLDEMHLSGYLSDEELAARREHAEQAKTRSELNTVLPDLPPFPQPKKLPKEPREPKTLRQRLSEPQVSTAVAIFLLLIASLCAMSLPWVAVATRLPNPPETLIMAAVASTITGIAGFIGGIIWAANSFDW